MFSRSKIFHIIHYDRYFTSRYDNCYFGFKNSFVDHCVNNFNFGNIGLFVEIFKVDQFKVGCFGNFEKKVIGLIYQVKCCLFVL